MRIHFERRLRHLETSASGNSKPDFSHVSCDDLRRWREILTTVAGTNDWSNYYHDLAVHAPSVHGAFLKAAKQ